MISHNESKDVVLKRLLLTLQGKTIWENQGNKDSADKLNFLLNHAITTVPYYKGKLNIPQSNLLNYFDIVEKSNYINTQQHFSDSFKNKTLQWHTTSGTTGKPLKIARDIGNQYGYLFDSYSELLKFIPGFRNNLKGGEIAVILVDDLINRPAYTCINPALNYGLIIRVLLGKDESSDVQLINDLRKTRIPLLYGRPRCLQRLLELDRTISPKHGKIQPSSILSSGDNLYTETQTELEDWFMCKVHNAYVSQEGGFVAVECEHQNGMHVLNNKAIIEILTKTGNIEKQGSGEIVITNLENYAMPFIRYKTDDWAAVKETSCECGYTGSSIITLSGRDSPYFFINNKRFNPSLLNKVFEISGLEQFQVIQDPQNRLVIIWTARDDEIIETVNLEIRKRLSKILPDYPILVFPQIKQNHSKSKRQRYVSLNLDKVGSTLLDKNVPSNCTSTTYLAEASLNICQNIKNNGYCIVNLPDSSKTSLLNFAHFFGRIQNHVRADLNGIVEVKPRNPNMDCNINESHFVGIGNSLFPPHTDGSYLHGMRREGEKFVSIGPPKMIALLCVCPADKGGESILIDGKVLIEEIIRDNSELAKLLMRKGSISICRDEQMAMNQSIFERITLDKWRIRFRSDRMSFSPPWAIEGVKEFVKDYVLNTKFHNQIKLKTNQVLLIDNFRMLHGRLPFELINAENRHLRRVWIFDDNYIQYYNLDTNNNMHRCFDRFEKYKCLDDTNSYPSSYLEGFQNGIYLSPKFLSKIE